MSLSDLFYRGSSRKGGTRIVVPGASSEGLNGRLSGNSINSEMETSSCGKPDATSAITRTTGITLQDRPLVGTLLSASADGMGELFPVYLGKNLIGRADDCDIRLLEETVSHSHAVLLIRTITDEYGQVQLTATLTDSDSTTGSYVDGVKAEYDRLPLYNGSTICIGQGYILTLYLFNPWIQGFGRNPEFVRVKSEELRVKSEELRVKSEELRAKSEDEIGSGAVGVEDEFSFYGRAITPKVDHAHAATACDNRDFYNSAATRNPNAAPGTVVGTKR